MEFEIPDALEQRKDVGTYIERKITPLLLAQAQTMYDAGTPLTFGEITIDAQEIHVGHGRKTLAWNDVGSIKLDEERILIYQQGRKNVWYHQRVAHIPNVQVFKELVDSILQTHARQQFPHILSVYSSGTPITFGRLSLDQQGVTIDGGRKFLPWSQVQDIKVDMSTQKISIEAKGKVVNWQTVSTTEIPDVPVLQQLVAHILYKNQQQTRTHIDNELPHIISSYTAGIPVSFGRVSFSLQGIAVDGGKQFLPWSEITSFYIRTYIGGDRLTIVKKGKMLAWQALRTSELGDVDLLQNFIDYLKDTQQ